MRWVVPSHILVVDDDDGVRALVARVLQTEGYEVVAVADGLAAFTAVLTADQPYDLVVTNNRMPRMGGAELIARLRGIRPTIPILHLDDASAALGYIPPDVTNLNKPFDLGALLQAVAHLLGRHG
jgi:CheY-like chemotaxis protein